MQFRLSIVLATLLAACTFVSAQEIDEIDPVCPDGFFPGVVRNEAQYNIPIDVMAAQMGSFFNAEWYTFGPTNTTGKDMEVGATRDGYLAGEYFKERIVRSFQTPGQKMLAWVADAPLNFVDPSDNKTVTFASYTEEMRFTSICSGKATLFSLWNTHCGLDYMSSWNIWYTFRSQVIQGQISLLGGKQFLGNCPSDI